MYIVWTRNRLVLIVPILALCGGFLGGTSIVVLDVLACLHGWQPKSKVAYDNLTIALFATTITVNWLCTALIIGRIWWVGRRVGVSGEKSAWQKYGKVVRALVESGFLYSFVMGAYLILTLMGSVSGFQPLKRIKS